MSNEIWIVKGVADGGEWVYLPDYAALQEFQVQEEVLPADGEWLYKTRFGYPPDNKDRVNAAECVLWRYGGQGFVDAVMAVRDARREGFKGTLAERLEYLQWEIVRVRVVEG